MIVWATTIRANGINSIIYSHKYFHFILLPSLTWKMAKGWFSIWLNYSQTEEGPESMVCVINSSSRQRKEGREILLMYLNCHVVLFAKFKTPIRICAATHSLFHFHALQLIYPSIQAMKFQPSPVQLVRQINRQRGILHCIAFISNAFGMWLWLSSGKDEIAVWASKNWQSLCKHSTSSSVAGGGGYQLHRLARALGLVCD